jgi:hypothetical protein
MGQHLFTSPLACAPGANTDMRHPLVLGIRFLSDLLPLGDDVVFRKVNFGLNESRRQRLCLCVRCNSLPSPSPTQRTDIVAVDFPFLMSVVPRSLCVAVPVSVVPSTLNQT